MPLTRLSKGLVERDLIFEPFRNLLINGNMDHWQRGESFSDPYGYVADRWGFHNDTADATVERGTEDGPYPGVGYLRMTVATVSTGAASQFAYVWQPIEGYVARKIASRNFSVSFWVRASLTGTFVVSLRTGEAEFNYCVPVTIDQANTWEYKTIENIPMLSDVITQTYEENRGAYLGICFCCGTNLQSSATSQWLSGNKIGLAEQSDFFATIGNTIDITQVQLEPGRICTRFEDRSYPVEEVICRRYYERLTAELSGNDMFLTVCQAISGTTCIGPISYTPKRTVPTISNIGTGSGYTAAIATSTRYFTESVAFSNIGVDRCRFTVTMDATRFTAGNAVKVDLRSDDISIDAEI